MNREPVLPGNGSRGHPLPEVGDALTPRELEVMQMIAVGQSNREIGDRLYVSTKTVDAHYANLKTKAGVRNRVELVLWWLAYGAAHV